MITHTNELPITDITDPYDEWQFQMEIARMTPEGEELLRTLLDGMIAKNMQTSLQPLYHTGN